MAKIIMFAREFMKGHPKAGQPTYFVEKIMACLADKTQWKMPKDFTMYDWHEYYNGKPKLHTIRTGHRWKAGDMASLRVWSGKPYRSKTIEFALVPIKAVYDFTVKDGGGIYIGGFDRDYQPFDFVAKNDGLTPEDLNEWIKHPFDFDGQIICWEDPGYQLPF